MDIIKSKLHSLIKESVRNVLFEGIYDDYKSEAYELCDRLKETIGADALCDRLLNRLVGQVDYHGAVDILREIYSLEVGDIDNDDDDDDIEL